MKRCQHTTPNTQTTPLDVVTWAHALTLLHERIAPRFARPEPRRRALCYLQGLLSPLERKNSWHLAEHAREARPYGMQRLLGNAVWDVDLVRDDVRTYAVEQLGRHEAVVVIDETSLDVRYHQDSLLQRRLARSDAPPPTKKRRFFS